MRLKNLTLCFALFFTLITFLTLFISNINKIRWDKVPIISFFVLQINLYPSDFDASYLDEPIKWYQLDEEPEDFEGNGKGAWFAINPYTLNLLKNYMRDNNLGIVPDEWIGLQVTSNFEECLEIFEFVELSEEERTPIKGNTIPIILVFIFLVISIVCWVLFFIVKQ